MQQTLRLASPYMRGRDVERAQARLVKAGYLDESSVDGIYGPVTANAAREAKYRLGYPESDLSPTYGPMLDEYLAGKRKPSPAMRARARRRKPKPVARTVGSLAADLMVRWYERGWREYPSGSNRVQPLMLLCRELRLSSYYSNMGFPWCALAVFVAALVNGSKSAKACLRDGLYNGLYTPTIRQVAENGAHGLRAVSPSKITHGVCLLFNFGGTNGDEVDHIGIALGAPGQNVTAAGRRWKCPAGHVVTVEGNTSYDESGSQANGGAVAIRVRPLSQVRTPFTLS